MIELHAHLGSLTTPRNLWRIMNEQGISLGIKDYNSFKKIILDVERNNYTEYLKKFEMTHKIQSSPNAIEKCVFYAIEDAYIDHGLKGIEIRFNPMLRNSEGHFNLDNTILYACMGLQKALEAFPIKAGIIISTDKSFTEKQHMILLEKAIKYKSMGVIGIDCSGNTDSIEDIRRLKQMYESAEGILNKTVHAGETYHMIDEIRIAMDELNVSRIGHGIQAYRDIELMDSIRLNGICLEICPVSNLTTGVFKQHHGLMEAVETLYRNGVDMTFNTDGTVFLKTDLKSQFISSFELETRTPDINKIYNDIRENSEKYTFL